MHVLNLSAKAQQFYEAGRSKTLISGYERNVLVRNDFDNCLFVDASYVPQPGDTLFRCQTINQQTVISLKQSIPCDDNLVEIALKGKFSPDEWETILSSTNGLLFSPELDPLSDIAACVNPMLEKKILKLDKIAGFILKQEIQRFWALKIGVKEFIKTLI